MTLNDPVYVEAAQALARRMVKEGGATTKDRADLWLPPVPDPAAQARRSWNRLVELFNKARERLRRRPKEAAEMATEPLGPLPPGWTRWTWRRGRWLAMCS